MFVRLNSKEVIQQASQKNQDKSWTEKKMEIGKKMSSFS